MTEKQQIFLKNFEKGIYEFAPWVTITEWSDEFGYFGAHIKWFYYGEELNKRIHYPKDIVDQIEDLNVASVGYMSAIEAVKDIVTINGSVMLRRSV